MKLIFLDTETTGNDLKQDRLCQLCYKVDDKIITKNFKPTIPISIKAMSITNITNKMVENEEIFKDSQTYKDLEVLLENNILVAHNAKFDIAMLASEGLKVPNFICTLRLARYLDDQQEIPEYNLQFLRYYYGVEVDALPHSADGDVMVLEFVFKHLCKIAQEKSNTKTNYDEMIKRMMEISAKPSLIRKFAFGKYNSRFVEEIAKEDRGYLEWFLREKEKEGDDEDWIYTLKYYLGQLLIL
ncbi:MAG: 3'-5' exonuclease [Patescibacteria group bacterium]